MAVIVRDAVRQDVPAICALGLADTAFQVSSRIPFYEPAEVEEWIGKPGDNLVCVADTGAEVVGFLFCKIMSYHWALLDNFYVAPEHRDGVIGTTLLQELIHRLKNRNILYLSSLVEHDRAAIGAWLNNRGFLRSKRYDWYELFLD